MVGIRRRLTPLVAVLSLLAVPASPASPAFAAPPPNDDFAGATALASWPSAVTANLAEATREAGEPSSCGDEEAGTVWYRFTPTASALVEFRLRGSGGFDVETIALYRGTWGSLTSLGCAVHSVLGNDGAAVLGELTARTTYYVQVASFGPGTPTLTVRRRTHPYPVVDRQGTYRVRDSFTTGDATTSFTYGAPADHPVFGDWDGDGRSTVGVVRGNRWLLRDSNTAGTPQHDFRYGSAGDVPVVGDWDGDGDVTPGVVRGNTWYLRNSNTQGVADVSLTFGRAGDVPVVGDWHDTGVTEVGVFRDGLWIYPDPDIPSGRSFRFGSAGDRPLVADWDSDGYATPGVVRGNTWYLRNSLSTGDGDVSFRYGSSCDRALTLTQALTRAACDP